MRGLVASLVGLVLAATPLAAAEITWPVELIDPGAATAPADLMLPMPCGAGMAFQRVTIPVDPDDPLADRRLRLGQSQDDTGYSDYLRPEFLRGAFDDPGEGTTHFYIARYEMTVGQYEALTLPCREPTRRDRFAKGGLSWFEAVSLGQAYTSWLWSNAAQALPTQDEALAFARLPSEAEWEYATRGGARIDPTAFPARRFFSEGSLGDYAAYFAPGSSRGQVGPIGLKAPNPLGLYDVYGNAEELILEPFRLNAVGRAHGQAGGIVTRGGSALSTEGQIYSAQRTEYPPFSTADGAPLSADTFGVRLVLATHVATSDGRLSDIQARWIELSQGGSEAARDDPLAQLAELIDNEVDPRRQMALSDLQLAFRVARDTAQTAARQAAKSTLLSGAVFVDSLQDDNRTIERRISNIRMLTELLRISTGDQATTLTRQIGGHTDTLEELRRQQASFLLSFRSALETLVDDVAPEDREAAYEILRGELAQSGQVQILGTLDRFWSDLADYAARPDLDQDALLALALE